MSEINAGPSSLIEAEQQAITLQSEITAIVITDQQSYDLAVDKRTAAKDWLKRAEAWFDTIQKPAYDAYQNILKQRKLVCDPTEQAIRRINSGLVNWDNEQERQRRERQLEAEAEARKKAEADRVVEAARLEQQGAEAETVEAALDAPIIPAPVQVEPNYERSKAVNFRDNWKGEVVDFHKLIQAVAKDKSKIGLLQVNQSALNQMAKALKDQMQIPGCKAFNDKIAASGRGY